MLLVILMLKKSLERFTKINSKKQIKNNLKRKSEKLHVKWKSYNSSLKNLIDKKDIKMSYIKMNYFLPYS